MGGDQLRTDKHRIRIYFKQINSLNTICLHGYLECKLFLKAYITSTKVLRYRKIFVKPLMKRLRKLMIVTKQLITINRLIFTVRIND